MVYKTSRIILGFVWNIPTFFSKKRKVNGTHKRILFIFDDAPLEILKVKDQNIDMYQKSLSMDSFLIKFLSRKDSLIISVKSAIGTTTCAAAMTERNSIPVSTQSNSMNVDKEPKDIQKEVEEGESCENSVQETQDMEWLVEKKVQIHGPQSLPDTHIN